MRRAGPPAAPRAADGRHGAPARSPVAGEAVAVRQVHQRVARAAQQIVIRLFGLLPEGRRLFTDDRRQRQRRRQRAEQAAKPADAAHGGRRRSDRLEPAIDRAEPAAPCGLSPMTTTRPALPYSCPAAIAVPARSSRSPQTDRGRSSVIGILAVSAALPRGDGRFNGGTIPDQAGVCHAYVCRRGVADAASVGAAIADAGSVGHGTLAPAARLSTRQGRLPIVPAPPAFPARAPAPPSRSASHRAARPRGGRGTP